MFSPDSLSVLADVSGVGGEGGEEGEDGDDVEYNYLADQVDEGREEFRNDRAVRIPRMCTCI